MFALWYLSLAIDEIRKHFGWSSIFDIFKTNKTADNKAIEDKLSSSSLSNKDAKTTKVPENVPKTPEIQKSPEPKSTPKYEPPKVELPKVTPPKVEPPKVDPVKAEPPKIEPPKAVPPKMELPKAELPKAELPKSSPPVEPPKPVTPPKSASPAPSPSPTFTPTFPSPQPQQQPKLPSLSNNGPSSPFNDPLDRKLFGATNPPARTFENGDDTTKSNIKNATSSFLAGEGGTSMNNNKKPTEDFLSQR